MLNRHIFITLGILLPALQAAAAESTAATHPLNPLGDTAGGAPELYGRIIRAFLGAMGATALFFFIFGGLKLLASQGNQEKVKSGRDTLLWAAIGLVVAFSSYIILRFVIKAIITRER
jgi:hypothetical protein